MKKSNGFNLPKNIKQMGNIEEDFKIYMEDYVFTYLQQYSKEARGEERIAVLIGENYIIDGIETLFINGAIKGKYAEQENGMLKFSNESQEYIESQIDKYFKGCKIVGWYYSQPGFSDYINEGYINYHKENFNEEKQVFFLSDPVENMGNFYKYNNNDLKALKGFIIYYEKNEAMSNYMLANKTLDIKSEEEKFRAKDERLINMSRGSNSKTRVKAMEENKKITNIFGSLSAVLFLVCFIMGAGLIQSDDRISELEKRLVKLDESYRYVLSQMKDDNVQSVFAENNNVVTTKKEMKTETTTELMTETTTELVTEPTTQKITEVKTTNSLNTENLKTYEVKNGDSLESISNKFYGNRKKIESIMEVNNIENPDKIYAGMIIKLP